MIPVKAALICGRAENAIIVYAPEATPAPPSPAIARPTIRAVEFGATPQSRLPTSNTKRDIKKVILSGKYLYALPHVDWNAAKVRKKAEPYHAIKSIPLKSSVIAGMAVPTIVRSRETYGLLD